MLVALFYRASEERIDGVDNIACFFNMKKKRARMDTGETRGVRKCVCYGRYKLVAHTDVKSLIGIHDGIEAFRTMRQHIIVQSQGHKFVL